MTGKLTQEQVLAWFGDDEKEEIAGYLASILNNIAEEGTSEIGTSLHDEIMTFEVEE